MILLLAAAADPSARAVARWLRHLRVPHLVIEDDDPVVSVDVTLSDQDEDASVQTRSGRSFRLSEVRACWFRRGELAPLPPGAADPHEERRFWERKALLDWVMAKLEAGPRLGSFQADARCKKLVQLSAARAVGLTIPETAVTTHKERLRRLAEQNPALITKGIQSGAPFEEEADLYAGSTTRRLLPEKIELAPERFSPRLVQRYLEKSYELRIFFLCGHFSAMALLPHAPERQLIDSRLHLAEGAYRLVPYLLPDAIREKLGALMARLGLDTGSIDMVVTADDRHVFLEVNPTGQLDWLSQTLGTNIERSLAEHLMQLAGLSLRQQEGILSTPEFRRDAVPDPAHSQDDSFEEAQHRLIRANGQLTLARPLTKPILRRFSLSVESTQEAPQRAPAQGTPELPAEPLPDALHVMLSASCAFVEGTEIALIYDFQRHTALRLPPVLRQILRGLSKEALRSVPIGRLRTANPSLAGILDAALRAGLRAGVLQLTATPERFPLRPFRFDPPAEITNAVIDLNEESSYDLGALFTELTSLGCEHVLIRCTHRAPLLFIEEVMSGLAEEPPLFIEWWVLFSDSFSREDLRELCRRNARITSLLLFGAPGDAEWQRTRSGIGNVLALKRAMPLGPEAGAAPVISELGVDAQLYAESQRAHSFFHRKLAISQAGEIKNAPTARQSFGTFGQRPLREIVTSPEFRRLGAIGKDQIEGCRDCAYRHACVDPREPLPAPSGTYHHATPCPQQPRSVSGDAEPIS